MDTAFFYVSKFLWALLAPDLLLIYLLAAGVVCLYLQKLKAAKTLLLSSLSLLLIIAILPVGLWLLYPLEKRFQANGAPSDKKHGEKDLQKQHDDFMHKLDDMIKAKEAEIMEV